MADRAEKDVPGGCTGGQKFGIMGYEIDVKDARLVAARRVMTEVTMGRLVTKQDLERAQERMRARRGQEFDLLREIILARPQNGGAAVADIAIKVAAVDVVGATHLSSAQDSFFLRGLSEIIRDTEDVDGRIARGDVSVVSEIARRGREAFGYNPFPFVTKYCCFHNRFLQGRDDYSTYDNRVQLWLLGFYREEKQGRVDANKVCKTCDYGLFNERMGKVIAECGLGGVPNVREKLNTYIYVLAADADAEARKNQQAARPSRA